MIIGLMTTHEHRTNETAKVIYETYCQAVGGLAFNGDPLPDWETFRADPAKQKQSDAWVEAAKAAMTRQAVAGALDNLAGVPQGSLASILLADKLAFWKCKQIGIRSQPCFELLKKIELLGWHMGMKIETSASGAVHVFVQAVKRSPSGLRETFSVGEEITDDAELMEHRLVMLFELILRSCEEDDTKQAVASKQATLTDVLLADMPTYWKRNTISDRVPACAKAMKKIEVAGWYLRLKVQSDDSQNIGPVVAIWAEKILDDVRRVTVSFTLITSTDQEMVQDSLIKLLRAIQAACEADDAKQAELPDPTTVQKVLEAAPPTSLTDDPTDPRIKRYTGPEEPGPQNEVYLVLSEEERAKGFIRPLRDSYVHDKCGGVTKMGRALAETYARNPKFYGSTYCVYCRAHFPVGEFKWDKTTEVVGS